MPANVWTVPDMDIKPLDDLMIGDNGFLNIVPSQKLLSFPISMLQLWCVMRGVYQFPTEELIDWLAYRIKGRKAIEICAGNGSIGRALGIPITDSYLQTRPGIVALYRQLKQAPIFPPIDVQKYEAVQAVKHFQPEVVIVAWATQIYDGQNGSVEGVDEEYIIRNAEYIHIGNDKSHGMKKILNKNHQKFRFNWLVSRGINPALNSLIVWGKE